MEQQHPSFKSPIPADDPQLDLYTIPSHSSWFSWADIHETEKLHLREFFGATSITRTPKIYKEYRDFIISKYRECPSRPLTFTEVRKSLVGDVSLLRKVFDFLDSSGLINLAAAAAPPPREEEAARWKVRVEEGAPVGVRVVAAPSYSKSGGDKAVPVPVPPRRAVENGTVLQQPPLASYNDVYCDRKEFACRVCKERSESFVHYQCVKDESWKICIKCFRNGIYGKNYSVNDFKLIGDLSNSESYSAVWTEAEILLLLESVLKHGDDWDIVAENVKSKNKADCISKLIQLPFGDLMLGSTYGRGRLYGNNDANISSEQGEMASLEPHSLDNVKTEDQCPTAENESRQNGNLENQIIFLKRKRESSDTGSSLMKQVALLSSVVDPHTTASAADAAISALCDEIQCPREVFDYDDMEDEELGSSPKEKKVPQVDGVDIDRRPTTSESQGKYAEKNAIPLSLRMRAATATALGAAAARAKLLADQEDREIESLVANIIEIQLKKVQNKTKHFDDLELIMEKEYIELEDLKESIIQERMNVLKRVFNSGKSISKDQNPKKSADDVI